MFLGLDLGTSNVKAIVVDAEGRILARGSAPVRLHHVGADGIEQDIDEIWDAALESMAQAGRDADLSAVRALGVSAQGGALQALDGRNQPAGRVISWMDGRGRPFNERLTRELGGEWFAEHMGHGKAGISIGQVLRLREERPELLNDPGASIGYVGDVVVGRLCGRRAHDATSLSIAMLYNHNLRTADPDILARLQLTEDQLPDLLPPTEPAGALLPEVAARVGLPEGIPVSAAVHDQYAAALGSGAVREGDVMLGAGTAWVLLAARRQGPGCTRPLVPSAYACTHVVEGLYGQMFAMPGGSVFDWTARLMGLAERTGAERDDMMADVPAGCGGARFRIQQSPNAAAERQSGTPNGEQGPTGQLSGLRLSHTSAHVLRAVVEGLALELARCGQMLAHSGLSADRLVMCGAAAGGRVTPQSIADATGLPIACVTEGSVSAHGAAVLARALAEERRDLADLAPAMAPATRTVRPGPDAPLLREMLEELVASPPARSPSTPDTPETP